MNNMPNSTTQTNTMPNIDTNPQNSMPSQFSQTPVTNEQPVNPIVNASSPMSKPASPTNNPAVFDPTISPTQTNSPFSPPDPHAPPTPSSVAPSPRKSGAGLVIGMILLVLILILGGGSAALAYGYFSTGNTNFDRTVAHIVMSIPFMPKTKQFILEKSGLVHVDLASAYVTGSLATKSESVTQLLGGAFDMSITGPVDFTDAENPQVSLNFKLTKELDADFIGLGDFVYFRINKIPAIVYTFVGLTPDTIGNNPLLNRWVKYDASGLDTSANEALNNSNFENRSSATAGITEEKIQQLNELFLDYTAMSNSEIDGSPAYKFDLDLDKEEIKDLTRELTYLLELDELKLDEKSLENLERLEISLWIEKSTYYMRKMTVVASAFQPPELAMISGMPAPNSDMTRPDDKGELIQVAVAIELSQLGEDFTIDAPTNFTEFETFMLEVSEFMQSVWQTDPRLMSEDGDPNGVGSVNGNFGVTDPALLNEINAMEYDIDQ